MTEDLDFKISEVNLALAQEQKIKEELEKNLENLTQTMNDIHVKQHEQKIEYTTDLFLNPPRELRKEIESNREEAIKLKEKEGDLRDELETLQEEESTWKKKKAALQKEKDKKDGKKKPKKPKKKFSSSQGDITISESEAFEEEEEDGTLSKSTSQATTLQPLSRTPTMPPISNRASAVEVNKAL